MKKVDQDIAEQIPISVSVAQLDAQFQHLRHIVWNSKDDELDEVEEKKEDKGK